MLSNDDWVRLLRGVKAATEDGTLHWGEEEPTRGNIAAMGFSEFIGGRHFHAERPSVRYYLNTSVGGLAPFEFRVLEKRARPDWEEVGVVSSSTRITERTSFAVNEALRSLVEAVARTIEPGERIVDRLLGDLQPRTAPPVPGFLSRDPGDPNPLGQRF